MLLFCCECFIRTTKYQHQIDSACSIYSATIQVSYLVCLSAFLGEPGSFWVFPKSQLYVCTWNQPSRWPYGNRDPRVLLPPKRLHCVASSANWLQVFTPIPVSCEGRHGNQIPIASQLQMVKFQFDSASCQHCGTQVPGFNVAEVMSSCPVLTCLHFVFA